MALWTFVQKFTTANVYSRCDSQTAKEKKIKIHSDYQPTCVAASNKHDVVEAILQHILMGMDLEAISGKSGL